MKAAVVVTDLTQPPLAVTDVPDPRLAPHWAVVRLRRAALNRLDAMMLADRATEEPGRIYGSDGVGVVEAVDEALSNEIGLAVGDPVVICPSLFWGVSDAAPGDDYEILGSPTHGTFAEYVAVPVANLYPIPSHLTWSEAAALPLAGMTAWRALSTRGGVASSTKVVIGAASSGVGSMAIQIAASLGAEVVAITSGPAKAEHALQLGAHAVVDRSHPGFERRLAEAGSGADLALDPTGALWQPLVDALRPGGRLVVVGQMAAPTATLRVQSVYWKQVDVVGSSMGSPRDFSALIDHIGRHRWAPVIDAEFPLSEIGSAFERLDAPDRVGKVVINTEEIS